MLFQTLEDFYPPTSLNIYTGHLNRNTCTMHIHAIIQTANHVEARVHKITPTQAQCFRMKKRIISVTPPWHGRRCRTGQFEHFRNFWLTEAEDHMRFRSCQPSFWNTQNHPSGTINPVSESTFFLHSDVWCGHFLKLLTCIYTILYTAPLPCDCLIG